MTTTQNNIKRKMTTVQEELSTNWQQILKSLPDAHPLQSQIWGDFKSRWGWSASRLTIREGEKTVAAFQVLKRKLPRLPFSILYVPRGPALDYADPALRSQVLGELEKLAKQERAVFIKIDPEVAQYWGIDDENPAQTGLEFTQELQQRGWRFSDDQIQFRNTVEMDLAPSEEDLLAGMHSKTRYNIRLAGRKGISIRHGTPDDFPIIAEMYRETAVRDNFGIRPLAYYLDAWNSFYTAGMAQPLLAEFEGKPIAAVVLIRLGQRTIYMYGASTSQERKRMPNYLLQWEAIRWAKAQGCTIYDFWGAPNEFVETDSMWGVWRFKKGFNGRVVRHIGAWDYVERPLQYWLYTQAMPKYLAWLQSRKK